MPASEPDSGMPAGAESAGRTDEESAAEPPMVEPKRTRNWGAIFQKTFDSLCDLVTGKAFQIVP